MPYPSFRSIWFIALAVVATAFDGNSSVSINATFEQLNETTSSEAQLAHDSDGNTTQLADDNVNSTRLEQSVEESNSTGINSFTEGFSQSNGCSLMAMLPYSTIESEITYVIVLLSECTHFE